MIEQMSNVFDQDRPIPPLKLTWVVHWSMFHGPWLDGSRNQACQGYWWCHFPWRFDSEFFHFSARKSWWPHQMLVRLFGQSSADKGKPETALSVISGKSMVPFTEMLFSCVPDVRFEGKWIHYSWRTISSPSKHFDKIPIWWRHWRGTPRTRRNIDEIDGNF